MITSEKELTNAATALQRWFMSQDIPPADAGIIMIRLLAAQLVAKDRDITRLQTAVHLTSSLLALDIADRLRNVPR